jgi:hypothetical protein
MRGIIVAIAIVLTGCTVQPQSQSDVDHQLVLNHLVRRALEQDAKQDEERRQNEATLTRYKNASNDDLIAEYTRYCPVFGQPCVRAAPALLVDEAERRGLLAHALNQQQPSRSGINCVTIADSLGGGITSCQ